MLSGSPYNGVIIESDYSELYSDLAGFMNEDWDLKPQMLFACSALLSGMILVYGTKCIVVNCIEPYARTKTLDSHRESFKVKKEILPASSLPPEDTRYKNVLVTCMNDQDGTKLVIGTEVFNALISSSLRLDTIAKPVIGPSTTHFNFLLQ